ncbi:trypsin-like serine peptidase [Actinomadura macrotermitis]|nr:trypsin-like peptidase domain-containing protein [Actinomadura macrotermitis]
MLAGAAVGAVAVASGVAVAATSGPSTPARPASARLAADPAGDGLEVGRPGEAPADVEKFWTPARIKAAKPLTPQAAKAGRASAPQLAALAAEPGAKGDPTLPEDSPDALSSRVSAASVKTVKTARQWTRHKKPPARTIGKLFGVDSQNRLYTCSATVISSRNKRTVWTAGHCVHSGHGGTAGFSRKLTFRPDYINGKSYGTWTADYMVVDKRWANGADPSYDVAAFTVRKYRGKGIQYYTGSQGYNFGYKKRSYPMYAFGYPARALPSKKPMNSNRLWYCSGKTYGIRYTAGGPVHLGMDCTMGNGASGGPWLYGLKSNGLGRIVGVNSMHSDRKAEMYSPYHGSAAAAVYRKAAAL